MSVGITADIGRFRPDWAKPANPSLNLLAGESPARLLSRWALGSAYAIHPKRISTLPALTWWTLADMLRGGTRVPSAATVRETPNTFAGVVRGLTPETMLAAMRKGFFAWCHCGPLKWWTRDKRMVLFLSEHKLEKNTLKRMKRNDYRFTMDKAFDEVVASCAGPRSRNWHTLTWITPRLARIYSKLHRMGYAHSFEIWNQKGELIGGGFGVGVGRVFFSESLFSRERDVSKMASSALYYHLARMGFVMCDGRDYTDMQAHMGYREISRAEHDAILAVHAQDDMKTGTWRSQADLATVAGWVSDLATARREKAPAPPAANSRSKLATQVN